MYEAIITAVGNILASVFSSITANRKPDVSDLEIRIAELEQKLSIEFQKTGSNYKELHMNQAMQLFFATLKNLDIQIRVKPLTNNHVVINISDFQTRPELYPTLNITAQEVVDFETTKTIFEMIGSPVLEEGADIPMKARPNAPEIKSALQIMQKSQNRFNQNLQESHLLGGNL